MLSSIQKLEATYYLFYILENFLESDDWLKAGKQVIHRIEGFVHAWIIV